MCNLRFCSLPLLVLAATVTPGCKHDAGPVPPIGRSDQVPDAAPKTNDDPPPAPRPDVLVRVQFALDSASLDEPAKESLQRDAELLKRASNVRIEIQGHADERGTTEYNLALGDRRANAVRKYLTSLGVANSRLTTVSYGEEKPAAYGNDETAWATNRRGELRIVSGGDESLEGSTR